MSGYTDTIRRWATDTRRAGSLDDADGTGEVGLEAGEAGRRLAVRFMLKVEREQVIDVRYQVFGCGFSMAACAVAADLSTGSKLDDLLKIDARRLDAALEGLPPERGYCADLAVAALQAAAASVRSGDRVVHPGLPLAAEHDPRVTTADPVYAALMNSPQPPDVLREDRHLFACVLAAAAQETTEMAQAVGLHDADLDDLLATFFPGLSRSALHRSPPETDAARPESNEGILTILLSHVPAGQPRRQSRTSTWLARILAARAAHPGHLWVAMGLFERPQLSAAIRRHLPSLAQANHQNMRWKRYLYKQLCERDGGLMCKAPNCGVCSDYATCFAE